MQRREWLPASPLRGRAHRPFVRVAPMLVAVDRIEHVADWIGTSPQRPTTVKCSTLDDPATMNCNSFRSWLDLQHASVEKTDLFYAQPKSAAWDSLSSSCRAALPLSRTGSLGTPIHARSQCDLPPRSTRSLRILANSDGPDLQVDGRLRIDCKIILADRCSSLNNSLRAAKITSLTVIATLDGEEAWRPMGQSSCM